MRKFWAIARREWLAYFSSSPLGYIILAAFWLLNGFLFTTVLSYVSQAGGESLNILDIVFNNTFVWFFMILFPPVITMRLISEERKSGSIEMLLTAPVSEGQVVLGKFAASLGFFMVLWLPLLAYGLILRQLVDLDVRMMFAGLLGIFLIGAFFLAIGLFASALAKNQVVAAVVGFCLILAVFIFGVVSRLPNNPSWRNIGDYLTLWNHMDEFARGIVDTRHIVYYVSSCALFLFLAQVALEVKKDQ